MRQVERRRDGEEGWWVSVPLGVRRMLRQCPLLGRGDRVTGTKDPIEPGSQATALGLPGCTRIHQIPFAQ